MTWQRLLSDKNHSIPAIRAFAARFRMRDAQARTRRLLRVLLVRLGAVPTHPAGRQGWVLPVMKGRTGGISKPHLHVARSYQGGIRKTIVTTDSITGPHRRLDSRQLFKMSAWLVGRERRPGGAAWLEGDMETALKLQHPLPAERLAIIATGQHQDEAV
jgi:hypothetical protein